jgi:hypothetical protein
MQMQACVYARLRCCAPRLAEHVTPCTDVVTRFQRVVMMLVAQCGHSPFMHYCWERLSILMQFVWTCCKHDKYILMR